MKPVEKIKENISKIEKDSADVKKTYALKKEDIEKLEYYLPRELITKGDLKNIVFWILSKNPPDIMFI